MPLLKESQNEQDRRVKETIIHVLGQISYKKGCLEKVGEFIADKRVKIKECFSMIPLTRRTAGGFMSPLKDS